MNTRVLAVLMWKHAVVRKRRFIHTAVDFMGPLLCFLVVFAFKSKLQPPNGEIFEEEHPAAGKDILRLADITSSPYKILYHPESLLTNSLMDDVGSKLSLRRLSSDSKLLRYPLYEEDLKPKEDVPPEKELPPVPADESSDSISKTAKEIRKDQVNAKLLKLAQENEEAVRLVAEQAQLGREVVEEAARIEKQRQEEERKARIAVGILAVPPPRPEPEVQGDPIDEDQFEWDHVEEGVMAERRPAVEGGGVTAFTAEAIGLPPGEVPEPEVQGGLFEEEQFGWDNAEEEVMAERRSAAEGEGATAFTAEDIGQAPEEDLLMLDDMSLPPHWIMNHPESLLTNDVDAKLKNSNRKEKGYFALAEGSRLADLATGMKIMEAFVIFHGMSGETWPERLNYTIRTKTDFHTETYESLDEKPSPHSDFGFKYGPFMRIQWAIDTSYIKRLTGKDVPLKLSTQEYPYSETIENENASTFCKFLDLLCWLSLPLTFVFLMCRLLQERTSGIQELMKMVGVSLNTLSLSHYLNVLPCGLIFATGSTILLKVTDTPLIPKTNGVLLWLVLFLYFNTIVAFAFVCSYISRGTQYAATLAALLYILSFILVFVLGIRKLPYLVKLVTGLLPHRPMNWFSMELAYLELYGIGGNFRNFKTKHVKKVFSILVCIIFMLLQCVLFYFLAWYLSLVRPGQYGQALPWNFLFKDKNEVKQTIDGEEEERKTRDPRYFEHAPANTEVGIKVVNVSKVYPKHRALKNVSLEVYKGEITVLVGHNGAGKTTLMSIITGMTSATEGKVYVNGKDTVTQKKEVRKNLGFCPQHNLFFDDLTVQEHIMFFTLLKKGTLAEARMSSRKLAEDLRLSEKLSYLTTELSGGMKRRTQLACALAGDANVLVLDEPTSGLDVETRRELWDLLLSLRGERTVLITTHFMEEADALGDRVAAVHSGKLRCFATTMHLKKAIGTGYRLSLTTIGTPKEAAISTLVKSHVPNATLKEKTKNSISYNLPAMHSGKFPELFAALEAKKSELGLDSIGVGVSTLEEVFLKLCSDIDTTKFEDEEDNVGESKQPAKKLTGILLYMRQLYVLLKRQVKYTLYRKWMFLTMQFILPIAMIIILTKISNIKSPKPATSTTMNLDKYDGREQNRLLYHVNGPHVTEADVDKLRARYPKVIFEKTDDVAKKILRISQTDILEYNKYLVGIEVNETDAKILYTTTVRHAAPVALNLLSNLLAAHYISWSDGKSITTMNDPIIRELNDQEPKQPKEFLRILTWGGLISFICLATNINSISLPCKERETGSRHIHIMSGCPAELHWLATLIFHMTLFLLGILIPIVIVSYIIDEDDTFNQNDFLVAFALILVLGSLAFFAFSYLVSFNFGERSTNIILITCLFIFCFVTPSMQVGEEQLEKESGKGPMHYIRLVCDYIVPPHTMATMALKCVVLAHNKAKCKLLKPNCLDEGQDSECCDDKNSKCYYYCIKDNGLGKGMIIMTVQFLVLMAMVFLTQRGVFNGLIDKVMNLRYKPTQPSEQDELVRAEKAYVSKAITMPVKEIPDAMLVDDLHKNYVPFCRKNVNALKGVSFSVKKGECFGLLGVNGAGKSTCFKILTAEESATRGKIFGNGYHLRRGNSKYLQTLGYCPQFFGLDMFQTGEENLAMVLTLRGFDKHRVEEEVKNWLQIVGLEKYAHRHVEGYSGGCVRRLGAAAALCGDSDLALLDEPSAGVDVAARRRLWTALRRGLRRERAIIITSHSMDEMEALCSRIAILAGGRMRALDTAAGLRAAHAKGHAVVFKLTNAVQGDVPDVEGAKTQINKLKEKLQQTFNCTLKDEHKTMLHYHINETMRYSDLFSKLESLREQFPSLIEDYSVTETTLEEVFLSFAKEQHEREKRPDPV